jgi:hypothetical protein
MPSSVPHGQYPPSGNLQASPRVSITYLAIITHLAIIMLLLRTCPDGLQKVLTAPHRPSERNCHDYAANDSSSEYICFSGENRSVCCGSTAFLQIKYGGRPPSWSHHICKFRGKLQCRSCLLLVCFKFRENRSIRS